MIRQISRSLLDSFKDLLPIIAVVAFFQFFVLRQALPQLGQILAGVFIVMIGLAMFIQGLKLALFPLGEDMAHNFVKRGSLPWLLLFSFTLGFGTTVAEPALIAVSAGAAASLALSSSNSVMSILFCAADSGARFQKVWPHVLPKM